MSLKYEQLYVLLRVRFSRLTKSDEIWITIWISRLDARLGMQMLRGIRRSFVLPNYRIKRRN